MLQAASVVGTDVPFEVLQAIADIPPDRLRRCLAQLQAAEFLYEIKIFPDLEYTFKHALTHEVAYGSLVGDRRRALHARIVEAIERLYADRLDEQIDRLAHHAVRSEVPGKAVPYLYEAGTRAVQRSANSDAVRYLRQGLDLVSTLPPDRARMRHELRLLLTLGPTLQQVQGFGAAEVETTYTRARELCEQVGEPMELFQTVWGLWLYTVGAKRGSTTGAALRRSFWLWPNVRAIRRCCSRRVTRCRRRRSWLASLWPRANTPSKGWRSMTGSSIGRLPFSTAGTIRAFAATCIRHWPCGCSDIRGRRSIAAGEA